MCAKKKEVGIEENAVEKIINRPLAKAVHDYMMPFAEYIILERALPRVEDGLKPVQRRILYAMHELNMKPDGPFKKSARVVGDCLGKYHPHGDTSIYGAMVNMAQDFNMRNTLVHGHGNFGSIDGDGAAAMRYTEVKLEKLACELLRDLEKDTVKWVKNFDDSLEEPDILPGRFPNLLVNGCMGIAIGLATKIPPHNITEVIDGVIAYIDDPKISIDDMLNIIKGPDFPTGGFVIADKEALKELYSTGKGKVTIRSKVDIESLDNGRQCIVITEIPYNVNKAELQQRILALREDMANKAKDKKDSPLNGIQEITDESDRNGIRVAIRLKKGEDAIKILNILYQKTDLQVNFWANMVAIADGRPQQMGLLQIIKYYTNHQRTIILKRSQYDLRVAKDREHILDGFAIILPEIDKVIALIKSSNSRSEAKEKLRDAFSISEKQADAILDLKLVNLTRLEINKIEKELRELKSTIAKLEKIVNSQTEQLNTVREELLEIRDRFKTKRLSVMVSSVEDIEHKPFEVSKAQSKRGYVVIDGDGMIKFVSPRQFLSANREEIKDKNSLCRHLLYTDKGDQTIIFSNLGNCYKLNTETIHESSWNGKGDSLNTICSLALPEEKAIGAINLEEDNLEKEIYIFTKQGMVKKSLIKDYSVNKDQYQVLVLKENDEAIGVEIKKDDASIVFVTDDGMAINTENSDYPVQGRKAGGVIGASLADDASVIWAGQCECIDNELLGEFVVVSNKGYAKRTIASTVEIGKRARKGLKIIDTGNGKLLFGSIVTISYNIAFVDDKNEVSIVNTEDILIDRNRLSKGKPLPSAVNCNKATRHYSDLV